MIVPTGRLIGLTAVAGVPLAAILTAVPEARVVAIAGLTALTLVVVVDALFALGRLDGVQAMLPEVVRLSKDREGVLPVIVENAGKKPMNIRLGLPFPRAVPSPHETLSAALPAGAATSTVEWPCTPGERGRYLFPAVYIERNSLLGFWAVRRHSETASEVRVYPNLQRERRNLAALFLHRGAFGIHAQRQVGKGREFEQLREYIPGDSSEDIHWKATAKRGHPITKVFQIERTQEVYVILDTSRLSARKVAKPNGDDAHTSQLERFITASLIMGLAAEQQGDLFGLLTFSDRVHNFVRAGTGKAHFNACRDALYTAEPRMVNPDFDELFTFIRLRLRRRALLVVLTNLDDPVLAESFSQRVDLICRRHLILVNMISLPGARPLFTEPHTTVDGLYEKLAGQIQWHGLRELERVLHRRGVDFTTPKNEKLALDLVSQYISVKQRQLL